MTAGILAVGGAVVGLAGRRKAARLRRQANQERKRAAAVQNHLARRTAIAQERRLQAQNEARIAALGGGSAGQAASSSLSTQTDTNVAFQKQQQASAIRIQSLSQQADKKDAQSSLIESISTIPGSFD